MSLFSMKQLLTLARFDIKLLPHYYLLQFISTSCVESVVTVNLNSFWLILKLDIVF